MTYDADAQEMKIKLTGATSFFPDGEGTLRNSFSLRRALLSKSSYIGSNAFGIKKVISSTVYWEHGVFIDPDSPVSFNEFTNDATFTFAMETDEARASKRYLRVALVGRLPESRVYSSLDSHSPTVSEPWESRTKGLYIPLLVEEIRVLDSRTGKMVSNFTPQMKVEK